MRTEPQGDPAQAQAKEAAVVAPQGAGGALEGPQQSEVRGAAVNDDLPRSPAGGAVTTGVAAGDETGKLETESKTTEGGEQLDAIEKAIAAGVERVLNAFEAKLAYDATKQLQVDRLHEELQQYRADLIARTTRPLVQGMIRLHDDIGKLLTALQSKPTDELSPQRFFALLEGLQGDVEILLGQNGVAAYREPAGPFNPRRQRALRKVGTDEAALVGTIAESIRPGFEQGSEVLEKERVATFQFDPASAAAQPDSLPQKQYGDASKTDLQK